MRELTILIHRDGALASKQVRLAGWLQRVLLVVGTVLAVALVLGIVLYGPIVTAAARAPILQFEVNRLRAENARVADLARRLDEVEARYAHLRGMLGGRGLPEVTRDSTPHPAGDEHLYVAPPMLARAPSPADTATPAGATAPSRWPLSVPSYRTRGLAQGDPSQESHSGLDLAVPVGSDVRASGGGTVEETGADSAYGLFVLIEHSGGYETMYGHLSRVLVNLGDAVRAGQVIALTGNTGRSTAPHLHFEIRQRGRSVDPLTLVREGR